MTKDFSKRIHYINWSWLIDQCYSIKYWTNLEKNETSLKKFGTFSYILWWQNVGQQLALFGECYSFFLGNNEWHRILFSKFLHPLHWVIELGNSKIKLKTRNLWQENRKLCTRGSYQIITRSNISNVVHYEAVALGFHHDMQARNSFFLQSDELWNVLAK